MRCKLTASVIAEQKAVALGKEQSTFLYDTELSNFGCRISPKGKVSWIVECWIGGQHGRARRVTIGHADKMALDEARRQARIDIGKINSGEDVSLRKKERIEKQRTILEADTLSELFEIYYAKRNDGTSVRYWKEVKRQFYKYVTPVLGANTKVIQLTKADIKQLFSDYNNKPAAQRQIYVFLSPFFKWLVKEDYLAASPMLGIDKPAPAQERERVLTKEEIALFWQATSKLSYVGPWAKILLLTAQRLNEVSQMEWSEIEGNTWTIPKTKTKNGETHIVPLSPLVLEILSKIPKNPRTNYVFSMRQGKYLKGWSKAKDSIDNLLPPNMKPWTFHDLRRTCATYLQQLGHQPHVIDKVLAHANLSKLRGIYQRFEYIEERRKALDDWSEWISKLVADPVPAAPAAASLAGLTLTS